MGAAGFSGSFPPLGGVALVFAVLSVPAFHSGSAVSCRKHGGVPGRLCSHHAWGIGFACMGRIPAVQYPSLFRQHGRAPTGQADAKQRDGGLQLQTAQAGQHHNGNTHGQRHGLENDRNDLTN